MRPQDRFYSEGQGYFGPRENPLTESHCNVWDWDRLRMVKVKGTAKLFPPDEDLEIPILAQFANYLSPEVLAVTVDDDGLLAGVSTDPEEDDTPFVAYLPISIVESLTDCRKIQYSKLQELDRLGPGVDLALYEDEFGVHHKVAFKFNPFDKPLRLQMESHSGQQARDLDALQWRKVSIASPGRDRHRVTLSLNKAKST
ncbi:hypothetical protein N7454_003024 [Penicillium verhagenii]|nr:hypothetical protein N7454_003024 [Penicillium verhagenii]